LLTALARIKPRIPDVWPAIAGKGSLQDSLAQRLKELGLNDHVRFLWFLPDIAAGLPSSWIYVMPSQALEGFGLTLLESHVERASNVYPCWWDAGSFVV